MADKEVIEMLKDLKKGKMSYLEVKMSYSKAKKSYSKAKMTYSKVKMKETIY